MGQAEAHGEALTIKCQTDMGSGQVARVAYWPAALKASGKLSLLGRLGNGLTGKLLVEMQRRKRNNFFLTLPVFVIRIDVLKRVLKDF